MRHGDALAGTTFRQPKALACSVVGCLRPVYLRGYCGSHYGRLKVHGDPEAGGTEKGALRLWLVKQVQYQGDDCVLWPFASVDTHGYGHFNLDGATIKAHRYVCAAVHGEPPSPKHDAAHSCGRGHEGCVTPRHLRWATRDENVADMEEHGTLLHGSRAPWAKLNDDDVREIRRLSGSVMQKDLAARFGVSASAVRKI